MRRNFRVLGTALLAVLALGALGASAAQADGSFRADSYPATVSATATDLHTWSVGGTLTITCPESSHYDELTSTSSSLEITSAYAGCSANGGTKVTIEANGCTYEWGIDELTGEGSATGTQAISCPEGKEIEIARYNPSEQLACLYGLPAQGPSASLAYENQGSGESATVEADANVTMDATVLLGGATYCVKAAGKPISIGFDGEFEISAQGEAGEPTGLSVGGAGLYMTGEASEEPAAQPRFASELATEPLTVQGSQDAEDKHVFSNGIRTAQCSSVEFSGELTGSSTELPLDASYTGCIGNGNTSVTVSMNSCSYVLNALNAGPPYAGSLDLVCAGEGDGVMLTIYSTSGKQICEIKLPPQEGLGSVGLATLGSGYDRHVAVEFAIAGLDYQRVSGTGVNCGALNGTNGKYTGGSTLVGL